MKKIMTKYSGVIFLYSVIVLGVFALNARCKYLNEIEQIEKEYDEFEIIMLIYQKALNSIVEKFTNLKMVQP